MFHTEILAAPGISVNGIGLHLRVNGGFFMPEKKKTGKQRQAERSRNFATVVYPESAPENWREILAEEHVQGLISPLHDADKNPDGTPKKPHYHVMLMFESPKNFERQVKPIFDKIGSVGREAVNSARGYARYLCHLDNPEKAKYEPSEVVSIGGVDYAAVVHLPTDDTKMLKDIFEFIRINQIYSLAEFLSVAAEYYPDWFSLVAMSKGYIVDKFIKSLEWERTTAYVRKPKTDPKTGEVLDRHL